MRDPLRAPWPTTFSASLRMPRSAGQSVQPRAVGVLCVCATRAPVAMARLLLSHGTLDSKRQAQRQLIAGTRSARVRRLMRPGRRPQPNGRRRCRRRRTSPTRAPIRSGGRKALRRDSPLRCGIPTQPHFPRGPGAHLCTLPLLPPSAPFPHRVHSGVAGALRGRHAGKWAVRGGGPHTLVLTCGSAASTVRHTVGCAEAYRRAAGAPIRSASSSA